MPFNPYKTPISFALVAGARTPGTTMIEGADAETKWDERDGPFLAGAFVVGGGRKLVKFDMRITLVSPEDFVAWYAFKPLIDRPPFGKRPKALDVWHPWLVDQQVRSAVVQKIGQPVPDATGGYEIRVSWIEFRIPKVILAKPEASTTPTSNDPVDKLIASLGNQVEALQR